MIELRFPLIAGLTEPVLIQEIDKSVVCLYVLYTMGDYIYVDALFSDGSQRTYHSSRDPDWINNTVVKYSKFLPLPSVRKVRELTHIDIPRDHSNERTGFFRTHEAPPFGVVENSVPYGETSGESESGSACISAVTPAGTISIDVSGYSWD